MGNRIWFVLVYLLAVLPLGANGTQESTGISRLAASKGSSELPLAVIPQAPDTFGYNAVDFSPDSTLGAGFSISGSLKIWRVSDHLLFGLYKGLDGVVKVSFSPDSKLLAYASNNDITVLEIATGKVVFKEDRSGKGTPWFLSFGADNDTLISVDADVGNVGTFRSVTSDPWRSVHETKQVLLRRYYPINRFTTAEVSLPKLLPSSFYLSKTTTLGALGTVDGQVFTFDPNRLSLTKLTTTGAWVEGVAPDGAGGWRLASDGKLLGLAKGKLQVLGNLETCADPDFHPPVVFPESGTVGLTYIPGRNLATFDTATGEILTTFNFRFEGDRSGLAINPATKEVLVARWDNSTGSPFYDLSGRNLTNGLANPYSVAGGVQFPDGKFVFSASGEQGDGRLVSFELKALGEGINTFPGPNAHHLTRVEPAEAPTVAFATFEGYSLVQPELLTGGERYTAEQDSSIFQWISTVSPDGRFLYFARVKGKVTELCKRDLDSGGRDEVLGSLSGFQKGDIEVSRDGRMVLFPLGSSFLVYDNLKKAITIKRDPWGMTNFSCALSSDGTRVAVHSWKDGDQTVILDARTGQTVANFASPVRAGETTQQRSFSPDGSLLAVTSPSQIFVYQTSNYQLIQTFTVRAGTTAAALFFSTDGRYVVLSDFGGVVNFCNLNNGAVVKFLKTDQDWLFFTDDGYFEGSNHAGKMLALVRGTEAFGMDQLASQFNRPDILMDRLGVAQDNPDLYAFFRANYQKRLTRMGLTEAQMDAFANRPTSTVQSLEAEGSQAHLKVSFSGQGQELTRYSVYVNDVPLFGQTGRPLEGVKAEEVIAFPLVPGENKVEVSCFTAAGTESLRTLARVIGPEVAADDLPDLYYLGFGVSTYANPDLNLRYADKDALDLEAAFQHQLPGAYAQVHTKTFVNQQVDLRTMSTAKAFLAQARPQDTVILFIAGHGIFTADSLTPDYFYLAHNTDVADIEHTAIRFSEVEDLLQGLPARQKLFLMDTCNSGEVDTLAPTGSAELASAAPRAVRGLTVTKLAPATKVPRTWLAQRDRYSQNDLIRRSGAIVFSSSKGGEYSYESEKAGNGLFTSAILKVLNGELEVAKDDNGNIGVRALVEAVSAEVPRMTDELQHPGVDRDNLSVNFSLPVTTAQESKE